MKLQGCTILITRATEQAGEFRRLLEAEGARVLEVPTIEIRPRRNEATDEMVQRLAEYDWTIFTSANAVEIFVELLGEAWLESWRERRRPEVCAVGPATTDRLRQADLKVGLVPEVFRAEGVVAAFRERYAEGLKGLEVLFPAASGARRVIPDELSKAGARVDFVAIYDTVPPENGEGPLHAALDQKPDLVAFTSSSTARNFVKMAGARDLSGLRCAAIGPVTAATARDLGLNVAVMPEESTIAALVLAITTSRR